MASAKGGLLKGLGWIVWKLLAVVGVPAAKKKVKERNRT